MHQEILTSKQTKLLPLIKQLASEFYLVGGTAIALQIGHRRSIDFDLFTNKDPRLEKIKKTISNYGFKIEQTIFEAKDQFTGIISGIKMTFYQYPFKIPATVNFNNFVKMPNLLNLAAMKAYALGRRAKWKDYVDFYFILQNNYSLKEISQKSKEIFKGLFNEKLFRQQLAYYNDVDFSEEVEFMGKRISQAVIKRFLTNAATEAF